MLYLNAKLRWTQQTFPRSMLPQTAARRGISSRDEKMRGERFVCSQMLEFIFANLSRENADAEKNILLNDALYCAGKNYCIHYITVSYYIT
jgi:hypothetical protein